MHFHHGKFPLAERLEAKADSRSTAPEGATEIEVVEVPVGTFIMGAGANDKFATDTERPAHCVTFAHRFALGRCPVTVREYRAFAPWHAPDEPDSLPAVNVTWESALAFCAWLRAATGQAYRLPTESEWECACRAGRATPFGGGEDLAPEEANYLYSENGERIGLGRRVPVRTYPPNAFGLYELHGNVCEWVQDTWHPNYTGAPTDGSAWVEPDETRRVIRGGAWDYLPRLLRSAWRDALPADAAHDNVGFRVAQSLP